MAIASGFRKKKEWIDVCARMLLNSSKTIGCILCYQYEYSNLCPLNLNMKDHHMLHLCNTKTLKRYQFIRDPINIITDIVFETKGFHLNLLWYPTFKFVTIGYTTSLDTEWINSPFALYEAVASTHSDNYSMLAARLCTCMCTQTNTWVLKLMQQIWSGLHCLDNYKWTIPINWITHKCNVLTCTNVNKHQCGMQIKSYVWLNPGLNSILHVHAIYPTWPQKHKSTNQHQ